MTESDSPTDSRSAAVGVLHYGLGPIGLEVARMVRQDPRLDSIGAVDVDPRLIGHGLATLLGEHNGRKSPTVVPPTELEAPSSDAGAQVAVHCTGSSLPRVASQIEQCVEAGLNVVSTCEELAFPWAEHPDLAAGLDACARGNGVTILGTGVNPGFAMDFLPIVLSGVTTAVERVELHRVQDAGSRRAPLRKKVGAGLEADEFRELVAAGRLGHVGLRQSAHAIAAALGWRPLRLEERIDPIPDATQPSTLDDDKWLVAGLRQSIDGYVGEHRVLVLLLEMAVGLNDPRDEVSIIGSPRIDLVIPGGLHGDSATAAIVTNAISRVVDAPPGLVTMQDIAAPHAVGLRGSWALTAPPAA